MALFMIKLITGSSPVLTTKLLFNLLNNILMLITMTSMISKTSSTRDIDITIEQLFRIKHTQELIQNVVPHLSLEDREFLISGITPEEWEELFHTIED